LRVLRGSDFFGLSFVSQRFVAIIEALFRFIAKSAGKIVNALFGWAVIAIFGNVSEKEKPVLSGAVTIAALWPIVLIGIPIPKIATFFLAFAPIPKWVPSSVVRIVWIALAALVPLVVGSIVAKHAKAEKAGRNFGQRFWSGIRLTAAIAAAFLVVTVGAPIKRLKAVLKHWEDESVPLIIEKEVYHIVAEEVHEAMSIGGIRVACAELPWAMRAVVSLLRGIGGQVMQRSLPDSFEYFENEAMTVLITTSGVMMQGEKEQVARAHGFISEAMTFTPALQTTDEEAQDIERELKEIWRVFREEREAHQGSGILLSRVVDVAGELAERSLPYDEWQVSYRELLQLSRAIHAEPQLLEATKGKHIMDTMTHVDGHANAPSVKAVKETVRQLSITELLGEIGPEIKTLIEQEIALAKAELKSDMQRELAMAKMMGIAALLSIFGVAMLFVTAAFALATTLPAWIAALIVAGVLLVAAGATARAGWSKRVKKPLGTTQKTIKEDIQWAKNRAA
jgi:uncharacterized membrane protein YqjE